jgi:hypothetical protein
MIVVAVDLLRQRVGIVGHAEDMIMIPELTRRKFGADGSSTI